MSMAPDNSTDGMPTMERLGPTLAYFAIRTDDLGDNREEALRRIGEAITAAMAGGRDMDEIIKGIAQLDQWEEQLRRG